MSAPLATNTDHKSGGDEPQRFDECCSSYVATSLFAARVSVVLRSRPEAVHGSESLDKC